MRPHGHKQTQVGGTIANSDNAQSGTKGNAANPVFMFFRIVNIIEHLSRNRAERAMSDGMKMSHFGVLSYLAGSNELSTPARLASIFQVTRPTMTNTLQKLEKRNFIQVRADPEDGRSKTVSITDKGREAHGRALEAIAPLFADIVDDLGENIFEQLLPDMNRIKQYLDEHR